MHLFGGLVPSPVPAFRELLLDASESCSSIWQEKNAYGGNTHLIIILQRTNRSEKLASHWKTWKGAYVQPWKAFDPGAFTSALVPSASTRAAAAVAARPFCSKCDAPVAVWDGCASAGFCLSGGSPSSVEASDGSLS